MNRRELLKTLGAAGALAAVREPGTTAGRLGTRAAAGSAATAGDLQTRLKDAIARDKVPGASVAIFRGGTLETAAAGITNIASGVELTTDTIMHIGSITKVFTTTLVMQLVDEGRVRLDTPVRTYLPDFRVADMEAAERITVKMLLNHTSGIDGKLTREAGHDQERIVDGMARIATMGQLHPPGAEVSYCNAGMVVAGYLVQHLTGKSWYDAVKERIFRPVGMDHAIVVPEDALLYRSSVGHHLNATDGKPVRTSFAFLPLSYAPAGATAMMSATDLVTFARTHMKDGVAPNGHRLLSESSARLMRVKTASFRGPGIEDFGLGWALLEPGVVWHSGGGPGIGSVVYAHPASQTAVAVLTNAGYGGIENPIVSPILEAVAGMKPLGSDWAALLKKATDAPVDPGPYVGQYENITTVARVVPHRNGIGYVSRSKFASYDTSVTKEPPPVPLRPIGAGLFALGSSGQVGFINPDASGKMGHLGIGGRLLKRVS